MGIVTRTVIVPENQIPPYAAGVRLVYTPQVSNPLEYPETVPAASNINQRMYAVDIIEYVPDKIEELSPPRPPPPRPQPPPPPPRPNDAADNDNKDSPEPSRQSDDDEQYVVPVAAVAAAIVLEENAEARTALQAVAVIPFPSPRMGINALKLEHTLLADVPAPKPNFLAQPQRGNFLNYAQMNIQHANSNFVMAAAASDSPTYGAAFAGPGRPGGSSASFGGGASAGGVSGGPGGGGGGPGGGPGG